MARWTQSNSGAASISSEISCGIWLSARGRRRCPNTAATVRVWNSDRESRNTLREGIDVGRQSNTSFGAPGKQRPAVFALYVPKASARKLHQSRGPQYQNPQNGHPRARFDWGLGAVYSGASSVASAFVSSPGTRLPRESTSLYRKEQNALAFGYFLTWHNDSHFGYFLKWLDGGPRARSAASAGRRASPSWCQPILLTTTSSVDNHLFLTTTTSLNRILKVPRDKGQHDGYSKRASLALEF